MFAYAAIINERVSNITEGEGNVTDGCEAAAGQRRAVMMGYDDSCDRDAADANEGDYIEVDDKWHSDILRLK